jgi:hypothetical protein
MWDWGERRGEWDVWGLAGARRRQPAGAEMASVREPGASRVANVTQNAGALLASVRSLV